MYEKYFTDLKVIGDGRYSTIYSALDIRYNKKVAIKEIIKNDIYSNYDYVLKCFKREVEIHKLCKSQNITQYYGSFESDKAVGLIVELCDETFSSCMKECTKDLYLFQQFLIKLNNAFKVLREQKIMHRDIKPENIFIKIENGEYIPKLGDFGISRFYGDITDYNVPCEHDDERHTGSVGTYYYIAPEIMKSEPYDYKCDLFSLGVTLYISLFDETPYGVPHMGFEWKFNQIIYSSNKLNLIKTGVKSLDDLLEKLLELEPNSRITFEEYFNHPFFKETKDFLRNRKNEFIKPEKNELLENNNNFSEQNKMNKVKNIAKSFIDIMEVPKGFIKEKNQNISKINNIIYYDENIVNHLEEIHNDSDRFEASTNGAFLLCTNIESLFYTMIDIKEAMDKDHRIKFNLIVTGSKFEKVIKSLKEKQLENYISNICIYCIHVEKYLNLKDKYKKIKGIFNKPEEVIVFIENYSSINIIPFRFTKVLTFHDYKYNYFQRHKNISDYYGDFTQQTYNEAKNNFQEFINQENSKELKKNKSEIKETFKTFDLDKDLKILNNMLIQEYTKNTLYGDLNNWLRSLKNDVYEKVSYYTARLMYSLNNYGKQEKKFFKQNKTIYRGAKTKFTNLLPFERAIGKVITLSSFTSTSTSSDLAERWSGRNNSKMIYFQDKKFSVIYKIKNCNTVDSIPCGIFIQDLSEYQSEKEVLFQPFTFYLVKSVKFNFGTYSVDIELETIMKKEILEYQIRKGKKVGYDNLMRLVYIEK